MQITKLLRNGSLGLLILGVILSPASSLFWNGTLQAFNKHVFYDAELMSPSSLSNGIHCGDPFDSEIANPLQRRERWCAHPCIFTYRSEVRSTKTEVRGDEDIVFYAVKRRSLSPLRNGIKILTLKVHFRARGAKARLDVDRILAKKTRPRSTKK